MKYTSNRIYNQWLDESEAERLLEKAKQDKNISVVKQEEQKAEGEKIKTDDAVSDSNTLSCSSLPINN